MPSVMDAQKLFSQTPQVRRPRSQFNRSHALKTTFDADYLVPIFCDEVLPGDTFNLKMQGFCRMSTPLYPVMDNIIMETFFFYVPNRLLWTNWEKFCGAQDNPGDSISYTVPVTTAPAAGGHAARSLYDYLGFPTAVNSLSHQNLLGRACNQTWNAWFRDENLQNSITKDVGDGPDTVTNYVLKKRGRRHDYFTSSLPWPQKGTAVSIALGTSADVWGSTTALPSGIADQVNAPIFTSYADRATTDGVLQGALGWHTTAGSGGVPTIIPSEGGISWADATLTGGSGNFSAQTADLSFLNKTLSQAFRATATAPFKADLSTATAATVDEFMRTLAIQDLLRRDARGGTRYVELLLSHFGVVSPDFRLQRPEYLGGGRSYINTHVVPVTADTGSREVGQLAAFATGSVNGHGFTKSFTEHGVIIGFINVRADITYQQGLDRMHSRSTRYDYYWPDLAHIGEQSILNKEIYCDGSANDALVFGYIPRYDEYRYKQSRITGDFRSNHATSLDGWHLSEEFGSLPALNSSFIESSTPMSRVLAVTTEPHFIMDVWYDLKCARPMPMYSIPGIGNRF